MEWMKEYEHQKSVPMVCKKFSISRKTFYKWLKRFEGSGRSPESLIDGSRRPHTSPRATPQIIVDRLRELREKTGFGQKRLQLYLSLWYGVEVSETTIWKLLKKSGVDMKQKRRLRRKLKPNEPLLPGDRVVILFKQLPVMINNQRFMQYTAIDECTQLRLVKIYGRHSTLSALDFMQYILMMFPFHIRHVHTPLDNVFTSVSKPLVHTHAFTMNLRKLGIQHEVPTKNQAQKPDYLERMKRFEVPEPYCSQLFMSVEAFERAVLQFIHNFNNKRHQLILDNMTPFEKLQSFEQFRALESFSPGSHL